MNGRTSLYIQGGGQYKYTAIVPTLLLNSRMGYYYKEIESKGLVIFGNLKISNILIKSKLIFL